MVKCSNSGTIPYVSSPRELIFVSLPKEKNSADQLEGDGGAEPMSTKFLEGNN